MRSLSGTAGARITKIGAENRETWEVETMTHSSRVTPLGSRFWGHSAAGNRTFRRYYQDWLPDERAHALGIVLEINEPVAVVQFHLKLPQHCESQ